MRSVANAHSSVKRFSTANTNNNSNTSYTAKNTNNNTSPDIVKEKLLAIMPVFSEVKSEFDLSASSIKKDNESLKSKNII